MLLVNRQLSLTPFCCAFAAVVLLSDFEVNVEVLELQQAGGQGAAAGEGYVTVPWAARPPGTMAFTCQAPAGDRRSPNPSRADADLSARSSASQRVLCLFTLHKRVYTYGGYVCLHAHMPV